jgi:hypothetical protein
VSALRTVSVFPFLLLLACSGGSTDKVADDSPSGTGGGDAGDGADGADGASDGGDGATDGSDGGSDGSADDGLVGPFDGHYTITLHRQGGQFALGSFDVTRNVLSAEAISSTGIRFTGSGSVAPDGEVAVTVENDGGLAVEFADAWIRDGIVEANYTTDGEPGHLVGSKDGALLQQTPVDDFDGFYELGFIRDEDEVATGTLEFKKGRFSTQITGEDLTIIQVEGFVTSDGTVVLAEAVASSDAQVLAEASIDQDSFELTGIYRAGDRVGQIVGRKGD